MFQVIGPIIVQTSQSESNQAIDLRLKETDGASYLVASWNIDLKVDVHRSIYRVSYGLGKYIINSM